MRVISTFVLLILVLGLTGSIGFGNPSDDNYGKLMGWIVDPISDKPVNEIFNVWLFRCDLTHSERPLRQWRTDKRGYFSLEVSPGQYCLHISPLSMSSRYCIEPYFFYDDHFYYPVMIEKGKITEFRKKATYGGSIEIRLVDTKGRQINPPMEFPKKEEVSISIDSPFYIIGQFNENLYNYDDINSDGKAIVHTLFPSNNYNIRVIISPKGNIWFGIKNVQVKENEVTRLDFVIDLNDITVVEGRIVDID